MAAGVVLSYTESGVQREQHGWEQSLVVPLVSPGNCIPNWDTQLDHFAAMDTWTPDRLCLLSPSATLSAHMTDI